MVQSDSCSLCGHVSGDGIFVGAGRGVGTSAPKAPARTGVDTEKAAGLGFHRPWFKHQMA